MNEIQKLNENDLQILEQAGVIPPNTPRAQVEIFAKVANQKGLSPFSKQIHLIPRKRKNGQTIYTIQTSIDGYRIIAERTGKYAGSDDYLFDEGLTEYEMIKAGRRRPTTATATVYKILPNGETFPIRATARWDEYYPGEQQGFMWAKMPYLMLGKCSEALALRKAFPEALSGIYTNEEMQQADNPIDVEKLEAFREVLEGIDESETLKNESMNLLKEWKEYLPESLIKSEINKKYKELKNAGISEEQ